MSACISSRGEYSSHELNADHVCVWCTWRDDDALTAELNALRAKVEHQGAEVLRLAGGIAAMIQNAERAAGFIRQSRGWGEHTDQIADIYMRWRTRLRRLLAGEEVW